MAVSSTSYRKAREVKRTDRMNPGQWVWETRRNETSPGDRER